MAEAIPESANDTKKFVVASEWHVAFVPVRVVGGAACTVSTVRFARYENQSHNHAHTLVKDRCSLGA